jgi:gliding motility-associated-like protein
VSSPSNVAIAEVNNPSSSISGLAIGETILQWTVYNGPCDNTNTTDLVSIFIYDENQENANAGADQSICTPLTSTALEANSALFPAIGTWSIVQGSGDIADVHDPISSVTNLGVGTNIFRWTIDNGPCANGITSDEVAINVFESNQLPANAGIDQEYCLPTTNTTLFGSALIGASVGEWTLIAGTGNISNVAISEPTVAELSQGTNTFVWTVDNGACGITSDTVSVRIYNNNAPEANAGSDASFCTPTSTYTMQGNTPEIPGVGTWAIVTGPNYTSTGTIDDLNNPQANISGLVIGENVFSWTIYNGPCELPTVDYVSIFIYDENQPAADAGDDIELCLPTDQTSMQANEAIFPAGGTWQQIQGLSADISNVSDSLTTISNLQEGTNLFVWTIENGPCLGAMTADTVAIRVFGNNPETPNAGPDQSWCTPVSSTAMNATVPIDPRYGTWTLIQGNATIADIHNPQTSITDLAVGENCFLWTVYNGPCGEPSVDIVCIYIFDNNQSAANAGPDQFQCTPNTATQLAANSVIFPATGTWTILNESPFTGAGSLTDNHDPEAVLSGMVPGYNALVWTVDNGACENAITSDTVVVELYLNELEPANAGADQFLCLPQNTTTLNGSAISGAATGVWTLVSGGGTIENPNTSSTAISDLPVGINLFAWSVDNGPCGISSDTIAVQVNDPSAPIATAGDDASYCTPASTHNMNAGAITDPQIGTWTRLTGSGQIADNHNPNTLIFNLTTGENIFLWCVDNGACGAATCDVMSIFIFNENTPNANAGEDIEICLPATSINMGASSAEFPAVGTWQVIQEPTPGATTISDVNDPSSLMSNLSVGTTVLTWTVDNGPCQNGVTRDTVEIRLFDPAAALPFAGEDIEICTPQSVVLMSGSLPVDPNYGTWQLISGSGNIVSPNNPNSPVTDLAVGINALTWTFYNGNCPDGLPADTVLVKVYDRGQPAANAGNDIELCLPQNSTQLSGNALIVPATGHWEIISGFGQIQEATNPLSLVTNLSVGTNVFVWTISNGPCENGVTSDTLQIRVFDPGVNNVSAGEDIAICTPEGCVNLNANALPNPQIGTWTYVSAINGNGSIPLGGINDVNNPNTELCGLVVGEHTLRWGIYNGPCNNGNLDDVIVRVYDATAPAANTGDDIEICAPQSSALLSANAAVFPGVGTWEIVSGSGTLVNVNNPNTALTDLEVGITVLTWTIDNGPCNAPTTDTLEVRVYDPNSPVADAGPDAEYCVNFASHTMAASNPIFPSIGTWTIISGAGDIENVNAANTAVINIPLNENIFVWTIDNGACATGITSDTVSIYVNDASVAAAYAGPDQSFCGAPDSLAMQASVAVGLADGLWTTLSGTGEFQDSTFYESYLFGIANGVNQYLWTVDNGACGISTDTLTLTVFDPTLTQADAGSGGIICEDDFSSFNLMANEVTAPATAWWSIYEGPIQISDSLNAEALVLSLSDLLPDFGSATSTLVWSIDNGVCGSSADTITYTIRDCLTIKIPDAFSPNGDGTNDYFVIPNIDSYPQNSLKVFNRWGTQIYEASPYQNRWDGKSHHPASIGEELPVSTYYYILDLGTGEEAFHGFVYLKR